MKLEDKADLLIAKLAQCGLIVERQRLPSNKYLPLCRPVESAKNMQQVLLPTPDSPTTAKRSPSSKSKLTPL